MKFDSKRWEVHTWKSWSMPHWMLNPGVAINEVVLGQRMPEVYVVDKTSDKPLIERSFIPCPHCETLHDGRTWSGQHGTSGKNWFGLYCPDCGNVIPCLMNVFTRLILLVTFPLWGWFKDSLQRKWLAQQPARFAAVDPASFTNPVEGRGWIKVGLAFGATLYVAMSLIILLLTKGQLASTGYLVGIPLCLICGLAFGGVMKLYLERRGGDAAVDMG